AADQKHRAAHKSSAGDAVELRHSRRQARRFLALAGQRLQRELPALAFAADRDWHRCGAVFFGERIPFAAGLAFALPAVIGRAAVLADEGDGGFGHAGLSSRFDALAQENRRIAKTMMPGIAVPGIIEALSRKGYLLIDTNGTAEPGTIVVGSTPFQ